MGITQSPHVPGRIHSSLGDHRSVQIPYGRYRYYVVVALRLNYKLPSTDRIGVECDGVYPSIPACLRDTHILAFAAEYLAEEFAHEMLQVLPVHCGKVVGRIEIGQYLARLYCYSSTQPGLGRCGLRICPPLSDPEGFT